MLQLFPTRPEPAGPVPKACYLFEENQNQNSGFLVYLVLSSLPVTSYLSTDV